MVMQEEKKEEKESLFLTSSSLDTSM